MSRKTFLRKQKALRFYSDSRKGVLPASTSDQVLKQNGGPRQASQTGQFGQKKPSDYPSYRITSSKSTRQLQSAKSPLVCRSTAECVLPRCSPPPERALSVGVDVDSQLEGYGCQLASFTDSDCFMSNPIDSSSSSTRGYSTETSLEDGTLDGSSKQPSPQQSPRTGNGTCSENDTARPKLEIGSSRVLSTTDLDSFFSSNATALTRYRRLNFVHSPNRLHSSDSLQPRQADRLLLPEAVPQLPQLLTDCLDSVQLSSLTLGFEKNSDGTLKERIIAPIYMRVRCDPQGTDAVDCSWLEDRRCTERAVFSHQFVDLLSKCSIGSVIPVSIIGYQLREPSSIALDKHTEAVRNMTLNRVENIERYQFAANSLLSSCQFHIEFEHPTVENISTRQALLGIEGDAVNTANVDIEIEVGNIRSPALIRPRMVEKAFGMWQFTSAEMPATQSSSLQIKLGDLTLRPRETPGAVTVVRIGLDYKRSECHSREILRIMQSLQNDAFIQGGIAHPSQAKGLVSWRENIPEQDTAINHLDLWGKPGTEGSRGNARQPIYYKWVNNLHSAQLFSRCHFNTAASRVTEIIQGLPECVRANVLIHSNVVLVFTGQGGEQRKVHRRAIGALIDAFSKRGITMDRRGNVWFSARTSDTGLSVRWNEGGFFTSFLRAPPQSRLRCSAIVRYLWKVGPDEVWLQVASAESAGDFDDQDESKAL